MSAAWTRGSAKLAGAASLLAVAALVAAWGFKQNAVGLWLPVLLVTPSPRWRNRVLFGTAGVLLAMGGVAVALVANLKTAPDGAWRGDLIMVGATLCMALYNVYARPFIARSSPLGYLAAGMAVGGGALIAISLATGRVATILSFDTGQALSGLYLAAGGGAFGFFLWVLALKYASPTRVANTITINPFIAMAAGALMLGEPITLPLVLGLAAVIAGVWVATTEARTG